MIYVIVARVTARALCWLGVLSAIIFGFAFLVLMQGQADSGIVLMQGQADSGIVLLISTGVWIASWALATIILTLESILERLGGTTTPDIF
jgi:hypothetical protein